MASTTPPSEVILTVGATEALFASLLHHPEPRGRGHHPHPCLRPVRRRWSGAGRCACLPAHRAQPLQIVPEELKAAITPRTKAIILTSPTIPPAASTPRETLDAVHAILRDKPIFVLCDDVYRTLTYCEDYHSFAEYQDMRDRIIVVQSFSSLMP